MSARTALPAWSFVGDGDRDAEQPVGGAGGDVRFEAVLLAVGGLFELAQCDEVGAVDEPPVGGDFGGRRLGDRVEEAVGVGDVQGAGPDAGLVDETGDAVAGFAFGGRLHGRACSGELVDCCWRGRRRTSRCRGRPLSRRRWRARPDRCKALAGGLDGGGGSSVSDAGCDSAAESEGERVAASGDSNGLNLVGGLALADQQHVVEFVGHDLDEAVLPGWRRCR